jgi:hypothetical protein
LIIEKLFCVAALPLNPGRAPTNASKLLRKRTNSLAIEGNRRAYQNNSSVRIGSGRVFAGKTAGYFSYS